ncbi:hypothetical protein ACFL3B_05740 [Gemmatimonadota bacterium]
MRTFAILSVAVSTFLPSHVNAQDSLRQNILRAIDLPRAAAELRAAGVPVDEVRNAIETARRQRVPAAEAEEVLAETSRAVEEHGPIDNFGAFVQTQLDAGLRGRDLAAAIRAEHQRNGIGRGRRLDGPNEGGRGRGQGRPDTAGRREGAGADADSASTARRDSSARGRRRSPRRDTIPTGEQQS